MIITVDQEGAIALEQLCDATLRYKGLDALNSVLRVLNTRRIIKPPIKPPDGPTDLARPIDERPVPVDPPRPPRGV